ACRRGAVRRGTQRSVAGTAAQGCAREHAFISAFSDLRVRPCRDTSPHLLRYNERVRIDGVEVDDAALVAAFEAVEAARTDADGT
ncbi:hypothetical protein O6382_24810, partial [Salmonella enterica subsp. enterica]